MNNKVSQKYQEVPENIFLYPRLTYKSTEIMDIIELFSQATHSRPVYQVVIDLLRATDGFRHSTTPDDFFTRLRNLTSQEEDYERIFTWMDNALQDAQDFSEQAQLTREDKRILNDAMAYCQASICERAKSFKENDPLQQFWQASNLYKRLRSS